MFSRSIRIPFSSIIIRSRTGINQIHRHRFNMSSSSSSPSSSSSLPKLTYPVTRRGTNIDTYYGVNVPDPYASLENPDATETQSWVTEQNKVTQQFLSQCETKERLEARLKEVYNYERFSCPFRKSDWVFYFRNSGLQNQSVLYKQRGIDAKEEILLDPNTIAEDGTAALGTYAVSENGELLAYGVSRSGSDWTTISIMRIADNTQLADKIEWVKFSSIAWTHDHRGFFYSRYPQPDEFKKSTPEQEADPDFKRGTETASVKNHQVYYHVVGTPQSSDTLVHSCPSQPEWTLGSEVSEDGAYLLLTMSESCDTKNRFYYARLNDDKSYSSDVTQRIVKLIDRFEAEFSYINNEATMFYFKTNHSAGRYRLIRMDIAQPDIGTTPSSWTEIIPEHTKDVLDSVSIVNKSNFITIYSRDVKHVISLYSITGEVLVPQFDLPDVGSISGLTSLDLTTSDPSKRSRVFREIVLPGFDASLFQTKQVFYESKDDTRVPMFIVHRKDIVLDGSNPTWLYGYGGFNISCNPSFSVARVVFIQHFNGIFACPNIRGGGEYGEAWYKAGVLMKKQNVFDDFIGAAEYLIREKYTSPSKLAINGGSNGGLLVCACLNQRPELFGAVIGQVGVLDMLKFHQWTIGYAWSSDYGSSNQSEEMFKYLYGYSPVHNVRTDVPYPALLLCTSDHDDRVVPLHSYKYIAEVQSRVGPHPQQTSPLLIRIEERAGHGAGLPLSKRIVEQADTIAFMAKVLDATPNF